MKEISHPENCTLRLYFSFCTCSPSGNFSHSRIEAIPVSDNTKFSISPVTLAEGFSVCSLFACVYIRPEKKQWHLTLTQAEREEKYLHIQKYSLCNERMLFLQGQCMSSSLYTYLYTYVLNDWPWIQGINELILLRVIYYFSIRTEVLGI